MRIVIAALIWTLSMGIVHAQTFTPAEAERFLSVAEDLKAKAETDPALKIAVPDPASVPFDRVVDSAGRLRLYETVWTPHLEGLPQDKQRVILRSIREGGFADVESFGETGDAIVMAYVALRFDDLPIASSNLQDLPAPMLEALPEPMRSQTRALQRLSRGVDRVSQADRAALSPLLPRYNAVFGG